MTNFPEGHLTGLVSYLEYMKCIEKQLGRLSGSAAGCVDV